MSNFIANDIKPPKLFNRTFALARQFGGPPVMLGPLFWLSDEELTPKQLRRKRVLRWRLMVDGTLLPLTSHHLICGPSDQAFSVILKNQRIFLAPMPRATWDDIHSSLLDDLRSREALDRATGTGENSRNPDSEVVSDGTEY